MRNLAGVETAISNAVIRVELAKAGIPAYSGEAIRSQEVPATVIGVISFAGGVKATFTRSWFYWCVGISQPVPFEPAHKLNTQWGSQVRVDGYAGGKEVSEHGVRSYSVDSQEGLIALVAVLNETFGLQVEVNPEDIKTPDWLRPFSLKKLPALDGKFEVARAEVAALNALAGYLNRYEAREDACEEALNIALSTFGSSSRDTHGMRVVVANLYRDQARRVKMLLATMVDEISIYCYTADLERLLNKRVPLLHSMGRDKEARSVASESDGVRVTLAAIYRARREKNQADLDEALANKPDLVESTRYELAFTTMRMIQLFRRMDDTAQAEQLAVELEEMKKSLTEEQRDHLERLSAKQ